MDNIENGLKKRFNLSKKRKKDYVKSFKELYSRDPSEEELKAFIECMQAKKKNGNKPKEKRRK